MHRRTENILQPGSVLSWAILTGRRRATVVEVGKNLVFMRCVGQEEITFRTESLRRLIADGTVTVERRQWRVKRLMAISAGQIHVVFGGCRRFMKVG